MASKSDKEKNGSDQEKEGKRGQMKKFLEKNITKGEAAVKRAIGLGHKPNVIPAAAPVIDGPSRAVEVAWHPVGGLAGKWFAEETGLGKIITEKINKYPDPTQHWAVVVGDYAHQLWMDENFHVIYTNEKIKRDEWRVFRVGATRYNDDAIRRAGEAVIQGIRHRQPVYNLISNNCQTYVLQLLEALKVGVTQELGTTLAVYEKVVGPGKVMELFEQPGKDAAGAEGESQNTVLLAEQVMCENTTQLDTQEEVEKHGEEKQQKDKQDRKAERGQKDKKDIKGQKDRKVHGEQGDNRDKEDRKGIIPFMKRALPKRLQ